MENVTLSGIIISTLKTIVKSGVIESSSSHVSTLNRTINDKFSSLLLLNDDHHDNGTVHDASSHDSSSHHDDPACPKSHHEGCINGLLLPAWKPDVASDDYVTIAYRAAVYILALAYMLFGVNIITDRLVSTIEVIISVKRSVKIKNADGTDKIVQVPIWHPVVATLTVFVIGASSAEIFLPTIEVVKHGFETDMLGPSLIVGSGAYHFFLITGVCLASVHGSAAKPIEDLGVFFVTTAFAIMSYLWLFLLAEKISPGEIELWEALVTLAMFPTIVFVCWIVEKRYLVKSFRKFKSCLGFKPSATAATHHHQHEGPISEAASSNMVENEKRRRLGEILKELKLAHPEKTPFELEEMAQLKMLEAAPKGAAFYRMQAAKASSGGGAVISKEKIKKRLHQEQEHSSSIRTAHNLIDPMTQLVGFTEARHTCIESCGTYALTVQRSGAGVDETSLTVDYTTVDGRSKAGSDYEESKGRLEFGIGQRQVEIHVNIIDDDEFEEDKEFYVRLSSPHLRPRKPNEGNMLSMPSEMVIFTPRLSIDEATVVILDDDHCGCFHFESQESAIPDNIGTAQIKVCRSTGARGRILIPFRVNAATALPNEDYMVPENLTITFENNQSEASIPITIIDANRVGEIHTFFVELLEPQILTQPPANPLGNPVLGDPAIIKLGICEDHELSEALDRLLKVGDMAELISATTWADQFREAVALSFDEDPDGPEHEDEVSDEETHQRAGPGTGQGSVDSTAKTCSAGTHRRNCFKIKTVILWALALPWKLLAACLPPARYLSGWLAFILLLGFMAFIAALIGDVATHFGCTVGLKDQVTAVTLIAFGMGLPDLSASRHAAMHEKTADAAIGHITGSNAVNVFLGIGLAWTVAAGYKTYHGERYQVPVQTFGFTVTVYCAFATLGIIVLMLRRLPPIRGELGGPRLPKILSAMLFILLWIAFIVLSTLRSYCIIPSLS